LGVVSALVHRGRRGGRVACVLGGGRGVLLLYVWRTVGGKERRGVSLLLIWWLLLLCIWRLLLVKWTEGRRLLRVRQGGLLVASGRRLLIRLLCELLLLLLLWRSLLSLWGTSRKCNGRWL
jgi:hypothetical protein